jgi:hypothetical protein
MRNYLLPGENVVVGIRKHWLIFLMQTSGLILGAIIPLLLLPFYRSFFSAIATPGENFQSLVLFFVGFWLLLMTVAFFVVLTGYYLDILVITNQRVIDVDQVGLFARDVATAPLEKIEDVKIEVLGVFATFFKFGNIHIQTASEEREIVIKGIRYPEYARDVIMKAYEQTKRQKAT